MSITYIGSTSSLTSGPRDATNRASSNEIVTISRASPDKIERWAISNLAQQGSTVSLTNNNLCSSICMVSNASACIFTSTTNMDVVDLTTNYKVNYSGVTGTYGAKKGQQSAALPAYNIAVATSNSSNNLNKFNSSTFAAGQQTMSIFNGFSASTIIPLASSFLIGTDAGLLVEIDPSFNVVASMQLPQQLDGTTSDKIYITGLSYSNGIVLANSDVGYLYQVSWYTRELLNIIPSCNGSTTLTSGAALCESASGTAMLSVFNDGTSVKAYNYVAEIDFLQTPPKIRDILYLSSAQDVIRSGIQGTTGWTLQDTATLYNYTIVPRDTTSQTPNLIDGDQYKQARRIVMVDSGGICSVDSDTILAANNNNTTVIPTGKSIIEIAFYGSGVSRRGSVSKYNT